MNLSVAASISYGDHMGDTVTYQMVTETSITDAVPLFGAPTVSGDSIDFNPTGFAAFAQNGGVDLTDGQLTFMVQAKPGFGIPGISFTEAGITTVVGVGTDGTYTDVSAVGIVNIHEIDGMGVNVISIPINLTFSTTQAGAIAGLNNYGPVSGDGTWKLVSDGIANTAPWFGYQLVDLDAAIAAAYAADPINNKDPATIVLGATKLSVNLDNGLVAQSEANTIALIDKKDFGGLSITIIPEPTTWVLASLALLGLAAGRRSGRNS